MGFVLTLAFLGLSLSGVTERADNLFYDWALRATPRPTPDNIIVVAMDNRSIAAFGRVPWSRTVHAAMLRRLAEAQPRAVIYDIAFLSPSVVPGSDDAIGAGFAKLHNVYTPMLFDTPGNNGRGYDPEWPIEQVRSKAGIGHALIKPDSDGVVRRMDLALDGEQRWLHIAAMAAAADPAGRAVLAGLPKFQPRPGTAPLRRRGEVLVAFGGPPGRFRTVSFISVIRGEVPPGFFKDRYVVVGTTAAAAGDQYSIPVGGESGVMAGVEIQANMLETLLTHRIVREADPSMRIAAGVLALWVLMFGLLRLGPSGATFLGFGLVSALLVMTAALLRFAHVWAPPVATLTVLAVALPLWNLWRLSAVSAYMVEELSRLAADPDLPPLARRASPIGRDRVATQVDLLRDTVARVHDLRRLIAAALQSLPDPTVLVSLEGGIALKNAQAAQLFGDHGALGGRDIERFFASSQPPAFSPRSFEDPARPWSGERAGADGTIREIRHVPWLDETARPLGWVVRFSDVTALRRAEIAREEALQLLTHDMRAPQASIIALVVKDDPDLSRSLRDRIGQYARRTIELCDGFLQLARADAGNYEMTMLDIADVMVEAVDDLWVLASAKGVTVTSPTLGHECLVRGNRSLLIRALANLIDNAVKFTPDGGAVECGIVREHAPEHSGDGRAMYLCTVADHGPGMPPEVVGKLFQRFSHHSEARAGPVEGVGLGLAFVQSVIAGHDGVITCRSEIGLGTTFEIRLPALAVSAHGA